jgi:serine/threonine protein kinase
MTHSWNSLEGVTFAERFQLQQLVSENGNGACFLARVAGRPEPRGWLWLSIVSGDGDDAQFEHWRIATGLNHPNLLQVWETGRGHRGDTEFAYLLTEPADESLAAVLRERPLNQLEALAALLAAAKALSYVHARQLVHGDVEPASIFAVGDRVKLSSAPIAPSMSTVADLRALAETVHEMFTQTRETDPEHLSAIPQPFRDVIRGCSAADQRELWTAARIVTVLDGPAEPAEPARQLTAPIRPPEAPPAPVTRTSVRNLVFILASGCAALLILLVVLFGRRQEPVYSPPPPVAVPPPIVTPKPSPSPAVRDPLPLTRQAPKEIAQARIWRVVTYTYSHAEDAARMVADINRRFPHLRAERFFPNASAPPYYVAIGGRMTRSEAVRLRERAISSGLPPDTFVRNFNK